MPTNQLPYFPLHVADYLNDPAVVAMDADAEGCYIRLLCRSWGSPTPGIIPETIVTELAGVHRIIEQYRLLLADDFPGVEEFDSAIVMDAFHARAALVMDQLRAAFDTESRPGYWIQRRMVVEHRRIVNRHKSFKYGARKTNAIKEIERLADASRDPSAPPSGVDVDVDVDVDSDSPASRSPEPDSSHKSHGVSKSAVTASRSPFARPTIAEVSDYCAERAALGRPTVDPAVWIDHYESNGWRVGRNPMRDWRAAVRTWERNGLNGNGASSNTVRADTRPEGPPDRVSETMEMLSKRGDFQRAPRPAGLKLPWEKA